MYYKEKEAAFTAEKMRTVRKSDVLAGIPALVICFFTMYYADITVTSRFSLIFLDSLFDGIPLNFYSNALASGIAPEGAVYDIGMYIVFAIWNLPVWILQKVISLDAMSIGALLWAKLLPVICAFLSTILVKRIGVLLGYCEKIQSVVSFVYLFSFLLFFPVFVAAQYDIIPTLLIMYGVYVYICGKSKKFIVCFALAMTMKPFALFPFIAMVLFKNKKVLSITKFCVAGICPMLVCKILYAFSDGYLESSGEFLANGLHEVFPSFKIGNGEVPLFFLAILLIYFYAYSNSLGEAGEKENRKIIWIITCVWTAFVMFVTINPYWIVYLAPFLTLTIFMSGKEIELCLFLEWIFEVFITVIMIINYPWVYGGVEEFRYLILRPIYDIFINGIEGVTVGGILNRLHLSELSPVIIAGYSAAVVILVWKTRKTEKAETTNISFWNMRIRVMSLFVWIVASFGAFALGIMGF